MVEGLSRALEKCILLNCIIMLYAIASIDTASSRVSQKKQMSKIIGFTVSNISIMHRMTPTKNLKVLRHLLPPDLGIKFLLGEYKDFELFLS